MKVTVIGGGKGQSSLLRGLKNVEDIEIKAIVTVADDGGSTGRLREEFNIPAMGDIRNVMLALAESETLFSEIMNYRFNDKIRSPLAGHNLGNLILTALTDATGDFMTAIESVSKIMNVRGDIIPSSQETITLCAEMQDGTIVRGESNIPMYKNSIKRVYYDDVVKATEAAIDALINTDIVVLGVGSLYTSILPNLIIPEMLEAINRTDAKLVYYCNAVTQPGETDGYCAEDHIRALEEHIGRKIDVVVANREPIPDVVLKHYLESDSTPVVFTEKEHKYQIIEQPLLEFSTGRIRHDYIKVKNGFDEVMEVISCPSVVTLNTK